MNRSAKQHLTRAKDYLAQGEEFYRKAAEEITAAQEADPMLTQREIGGTMGRSQKWVSVLLQWHASENRDAMPFGGEVAADRRERSLAKKVLREAPPEQIAELVSGLEPDKQRKITQALDNESAKRQKGREKAAKAKERETLGDELSMTWSSARRCSRPSTCWSRRAATSAGSSGRRARSAPRTRRRHGASPASTGSTI